MIHFDKVGKLYPAGNLEYAALKDISFSIRQGEYVLVTGKSGSGKSTLLNILTGIDSASSGTLTVNGTSIFGMSEQAMTKWRGENVGIVFQFFQLIPTLSVLENLLLPMDLVEKIPANQRKARAAKLLATVGLSGHADKMPSALSGGEQQRVAIARALANNVDLIVADEPTGNLDSQNADLVYKLLAELHEQGKTIVMVTHEKELTMGASRKIVIRDGRIEEDTILERVAG